MAAKDVMTPMRGAISENDSILDAARHLVELRVPAIPVVGEGNSIKGLLTHRDIVDVLARGSDPAKTAAGAVSRPSTVVEAAAPLEDLIPLLNSNPDLRLPVVDDHGLAGVITRDDVQAQLRVAEELGPNVTNLVREVSPEDPTSGRPRGVHLLAGLSALHCVRRAMSAAGKSDVESILDFACGHGRILRLLRAAFPEARFAACDIDRHGVDFCARTFGAIPIYSSEDPTEIEIDEQFELIWCGSLFTHLDSNRWPGFLALLESSLVTGGLLVFTTLGRHDHKTLHGLGLTDTQVESVLGDLDGRGFGYVDYEAQTNWGLSLALPEWVGKQIEKQHGLELLSYDERAWDAPIPYQDVVSCIRMRNWEHTQEGAERASP